ncbi:conserved exported hypothetical protein [Microbacterium sp. 8M]|uniref:DUF3465 domain-containing protein n=1 Tax=Microbacterium sp. 8M TaxID=2653153 RepID=UPI0012F0F02A|nr:DUF3465 domain-containing protein [Microbacterium sp. 8M]VXB19751.1 conserved exported hypothetical protein [Microbacterium sp. 8M]
MTRRTKWATVVVVIALIALGVLAGGQGWIAGAPAGTAVAPTPAAVASPSAAEVKATASDAADPVRALFEKHRSGVEVQGTGVVTRILPDDDDGSRHQKFILRTPGGVSILIAHNIDLAPRLDGLAVGDRVDFLGDYEWSDRGGTVHWTHHDPSGQHQDGWLSWGGRRYA